MKTKTRLLFWFDVLAQLIFWGGLVWMAVDHFWPSPKTGGMPVWSWVILAGIVLRTPFVILSLSRPNPKPDTP